jgi:predicted dehydrogenase
MKKIAVFGVGHLGYIHCKCILEMKNANLIGIYDIDREKCLLVAKELGLTAYDNPEALLQVCDVADIVTTTSEHYDMAKMAIIAGRHTFIEKPVVVGFAHAEELITLSKEMGVKVQVGHVERFNPAFVAARPLINNPMFIEAHRLANFNPRGNDVSVVLDLMIHDIDLILHVVNSDIVDIQASGVGIVTDSYDIANVRLRFMNGCVANLTASRISLKNMRKIRFFQPNAYISVDLLKKEAEIIKLEDVKNEEDNPFALILDLGNGKGKKRMTIQKAEIGMTNAIQTELESFLTCIENDTPPSVTLADGYKALKTAWEILGKINKYTK